MLRCPQKINYLIISLMPTINDLELVMSLEKEQDALSAKNALLEHVTAPLDFTLSNEASIALINLLEGSCAADAAKEVLLSYVKRSGFHEGGKHILCEEAENVLFRLLKQENTFDVAKEILLEYAKKNFFSEENESTLVRCLSNDNEKVADAAEEIIENFLINKLFGDKAEFILAKYLADEKLSPRIWRVLRHFDRSSRHYFQLKTPIKVV